MRRSWRGIATGVGLLSSFHAPGVVLAQRVDQSRVALIPLRASTPDATPLQGADVIRIRRTRARCWEVWLV